MRVLFLVKKTSQKILYMEAGKEFVDMLLGFLQLPVATILSAFRNDADNDLLQGGGMEVGSISNVYESLRRMSDLSLLVPKEGLLSPPCPLQLSKESPKLLLPSPPTEVYRCARNNGHQSYASWASGATCSLYASVFGISAMTTAMRLIDNPPATAAAKSSDHGSGYVQHYLSFIVTLHLAWLHVKRKYCSTSFKSRKLSDVDSMEAIVSPHEALQFLKVSFTNRMALTQVFGSKINTPAARN